MKLLYAVLPALVAASAKTPVYYGRLGEFCGEADNGDFHACHGELTCHQKQCVKAYGAAGVTGHLRGYHSYPTDHYSHYKLPPHYQYLTTLHDSPSSPHYLPHSMTSFHSSPYQKGNPYYPGHVTSPHPYLGSPVGALAASSAWTSVKLEDYTAEGQVCSGITGLGAGQKPCAPWLACYKHTSSGSFFGRAYGGYYGASQNGICKAKLVHLGQRCGRSKSTHAEINMGRCPAWSHCQPDAAFVGHAAGGAGQLLGEGVCTQTPIERLEDFVDPFHSSLS